MPPIITYLLTGLIVLFGATVSSMTGFGFGIATMPFMLMLYPPQVAVPLSIVVSCFGTVIQWLRVRQHVDWRLVGLLSLGAAAGIPLGGYVLLAFAPATLKGIIGLAVLTSALLTLTRREAANLPVWRPGAPVTLATGFGAGILYTSVGQPGLLAALFMTSTRMEKSVIRATLVTFFLITGIFSLTSLFFQEVFSSDLAITGVSIAPFYWLGMALGDAGFQRLTQAVHRRLSLSVLAVTSVIGVINGLSALL